MPSVHHKNGSDHEDVPSVPLPLPLGFALLPSRLPGKTLTPLLFTLINSIPVYLTLSPSHEPHLSLLPLLLSLDPPVAPLKILLECKLRSGDYSLELDGVAPFVDLWIPYKRSREICDHLGVSKLFWDYLHPSRGLLSDVIEKSVSWDENSGIGHNWLPSAAALPPSSYSLAALLQTSFNEITIIPEDRCITTPIDPARRATLIRDAQFENVSGIRNRNWADAWKSLLRSTRTAWEEYLLYPSAQPKTQAKRQDIPLAPLEMISILPSLLGSTQLSFTPTSKDLLNFVASSRPGLTLFELAGEMLNRLNPWGGNDKFDVGNRKLQARVDLGLVESLGETMVSTWHFQKTCESLQMGGKENRLILHCTHRQLSSVGREVAEIDPIDSSASDDEQSTTFSALQARRGSTSSALSKRRNIRRVTKIDDGRGRNVTTGSPASVQNGVISSQRERFTDEHTHGDSMDPITTPEEGQGQSSSSQQPMTSKGQSGRTSRRIPSFLTLIVVIIAVVLTLFFSGGRLDQDPSLGQFLYLRITSAAQIVKQISPTRFFKVAAG